MKNYRPIIFKKEEDIKNLFNLNAKDFATEKEKGEYTHFNICNCFIFSSYIDKIFKSEEEIDNFVEKNPFFKNKEIKQKIFLIMSK